MIDLVLELTPTADEVAAKVWVRWAQVSSLRSAMIADIPGGKKLAEGSALIMQNGDRIYVRESAQSIIATVESLDFVKILGVNQ